MSLIPFVKDLTKTGWIWTLKFFAVRCLEQHLVLLLLLEKVIYIIRCFLHSNTLSQCLVIWMQNSSSWCLNPRLTGSTKISLFYYHKYWDSCNTCVQGHWWHVWAYFLFLGDVGIGHWSIEQPFLLHLRSVKASRGQHLKRQFIRILGLLSSV